MTQVYTDRSVSSSSACVGVVIPSHNVTLKLKLSHLTPSTASELAAILEGVRYIQSQLPQQWSVFSDSKSALKNLERVMQRHRYEQLTYTIHSLLTTLLYQRHIVTFQWVPAHSGIKGNEAADTAANAGQDSGIIAPLPFGASDGNIMIRKIGSKLTKRLWSDPDHHHQRLYWLDPDLIFRPPPKASRQLEAVLHRLCLGVAYTGDLKKRIGRQPSSECPSYVCTDTITHVLVDCSEYLAERHDLDVSLLHLDSAPLTELKILGA